MTIASSRTAVELVDAYYASWTRPGEFDEALLREILAADLKFDGPLAGHRVGAEGFIRGVQAVSNACTAFRLVQRVEHGDEIAVLYDCDLTRPAGTTRFSEFFRVQNGRIQSISLLYDGTEWRKL